MTGRIRPARPVGERGGRGGQPPCQPILNRTKNREQGTTSHICSAPVEPGETFTYDWIATPAGTRWYHAHTDVATQVMLGLYGSLIVEPKDGGEEYDRDYTYVLSEWDTELTPDVASGKAPRGPRDQTLRGGEFGTDLFLMDGKIHEAIPPIVVKEGTRS